MERRIKKEVFLKIETNHYRDDFYQESPVNNPLLWNTKGKNIDYNKELYKKYNKECVHENINRIIPYITMGYNNDATVFKPRKYDEEIALKCGLMPFKYAKYKKGRKIKLIMLGTSPDCAFFMRPRLEAYQTLMSGSMSQRNVLESNEGYFRQVVGKETTEEVLITFQETVSDNKRGKIMTIAEQLIERGEIAGMQIGIEKGRQEGVEKGIEKGGKLKALQIARNLITQGLSAKIASKSTGLSEEEIEVLKH